tara:strand:- start:1796 stop:2860 length:1065 start_codon:yes stop_codon:yes gene_type:complete
MGVRKKQIAIACGVTGGRHPQMYGACVALAEAYSEYDIIAYFGFSGGSIAAALMSSEIHKKEGGPEAWIKKSTPYGKHGKVGGFPNIICNIWNLFIHGGLLNSKTLYKKVFKDMFNDLPLKKPVYAGAWCPSANVEVLFDLKKCCPGKAIACSAALPFAISPFEISNKELISLGYSDDIPGIADDPEGVSFFADGGISSALGVGIVDNADVIKKAELEAGIPIPVIGINVDPISYKHSTEFGEYPWYKKIWEACWGTIRSNVLDDIREARSERYLQLCVIPTPKDLKKFSTKFDASYEENLKLYKTGYSQAKEWLSKSLEDGKSPVEAMDAWYEDALPKNSKVTLKKSRDNYRK